MQVLSILTESTVLYYYLYIYVCIYIYIYIYIRGMEMIQLTGESGNAENHSLKHILPNHIIFTERYKLFKMVLMYGLLLPVNQDISWHQYINKRSANNIIEMLFNPARADQPGRCLDVSYSWPSCDAMNGAKLRHSIEFPSINQWIWTNLYSKPCVSDTSGVYSMVVQRLSPRYACFAAEMVLMLFRIFTFPNWMHYICVGLDSAETMKIIW